MLLVGGLIVILTFVLIVKKYEARLVLFLAGLLMCLIGGLPGDVMKAFTKAMVNNSLVPTICTVMGFSYVMRLTTCDQHLVQSISGILKRGRAILVPISFFLTWWISLAIPSASGCCRQHPHTDADRCGRPSGHGGGDGARRHLGQCHQPGQCAQPVRG